MADAATLARRGPLAGRLAAAVTPLPPQTRFSLRGAADAFAPLQAAFGVVPGNDVCRAAVAGDAAALWLGPDEWMLVSPNPDASAVAARIGQALAGVPHSFVDVSHRNTGFTVSGTGAATLLAEGCPLDLDLAACPVGFCSRTVLGKCEIVLWRIAPETFRVECWRSFAPYVAAYLDQAGENL